MRTSAHGQRMPLKKGPSERRRGRTRSPTSEQFLPSHLGIVIVARRSVLFVLLVGMLQMSRRDIRLEIRCDACTRVSFLVRDFPHVSLNSGRLWDNLGLGRSGSPQRKEANHISWIIVFHSCLECTKYEVQSCDYTWHVTAPKMCGIT